MGKYDPAVNAEVEKVIDQAIKTESNQLSLTDMGLTGYEPALVELKMCLNIKRLDFSNNRKPTRSQDSITGRENKLVEIPQNLPISLLELRIERNLISRISNLEPLFQLQTLHLQGNEISRIENLSLLEELTDVSLEQNSISKIENIDQLTNLIYLNLEGNKIEKIENLQTLVNLRTIHLTKNQILKIENLSSLKQLKNLYLSRNYISKIENLDLLEQLETLSLSRNNITTIENLHKLVGLRFLFLYSNAISKIENLESLTSLEYLNLSDNEIEKIENLEQLINLTDLNLGQNHIKAVPAYLLRNTKLSLNKVDVGNSDGLILQDNPLESPPMEVLKQGREFALEFLKPQSKKPLNECKVIIIGRGAVGKTSLQKRLVNDNDFKAGEEETHGIRKVSWEDGVVSLEGHPIKVHFWDFGGQHIQQTLHQFFYSENTVYILVLDKRKDESPEDFLELIKVYSNNAPVIIVYNNIKNLRSKKRINYELEPDLDSALRNKYPNIRKTIGVCCGQENDAGVNHLRIYLQQLIPGLDHVREAYPVNWLNIKNDLVGEVSRNYISFEAYEELCSRQNLDKNTIQKSLAKMLNDIGVITFFDRLFVGKYYILNPDWLTTGAYHIILSSVTKEKKGRINHRDLKQIFMDQTLKFQYKPLEYEFLLLLMKEFNLCHEFGKQEWLIPSSLETQSKTDLVEYKNDKYRLYRIKFATSLPGSIIHRFVARNINFAHENDYWRNGIVVKYPENNTFMYVESDQKDKEIRLWIKGREIRDCWEFFRKDFREFSGKFDYAETVEIDEQKGVQVSYQDLIDVLNSGRIEWYVPHYAVVNVKDTLGLFERPGKLKTDESSATGNDGSAYLKTFISYSKFDGEDSADTNYLEEFKTALTPMIDYNHTITPWDDTMLIAGENWNDRIREELSNADIVFVLVSNYLLKTKYVKDTELKIAFEREAKGDCIVVPIVIRDSGWTDIHWLSKNAGIPRKGGTISSWKDKFTSKDQAWKHVYDEVKKLVDNFAGNRW